MFQTAKTRTRRPLTFVRPPHRPVEDPLERMARDRDRLMRDHGFGRLGG